MKIVLVLAAVAGAVVCKNTGRVVNGKPAEVGQFPWQVGVIIMIGEKEALCGGGLISNEWVLTAAHCLNGDDYQIVLGATLLKDEEEGKVTRGVKKIVAHKDYNQYNLRNDIGLLQLKEPVELTDNIKIISLPKSGDILQPATSVTASGWGYFNKGNKLMGTSPTLQWVEVKTISNKDCDVKLRLRTYEKVVCTSSVNKQSLCQGDSGGPLAKADGNDGNAVLVAVASFISRKGCLSGDPNGYTRTEPYLDWIEEISGVKS